jgi:hypothetical protein
MEVGIQMLDLAIVFAAVSLTLLIVTVRSFGRVLATQRSDQDRIR